MRTNKLYPSASKYIFGADEIPFLGCFIGKRGLRAEPAKIKAIVDWPIPKNKRRLALVAWPCQNLNKYSEIYVDMARPLTGLLKKDTDWRWGKNHDDAFRAIIESFTMFPFWRFQKHGTLLLLSAMHSILL